MSTVTLRAIVAMLVPLFLMFRNRPANRFEPEPNAELLVPGQVPRELNKASVLAACRFALGIDKKEVWKGRALIGERRFWRRRGDNCAR